MNTQTAPERRGLPSASSMDRLAACPGSLALENECPEIESADANLGTEIHSVLAGDETPEIGFVEITSEMCEEIAKRIADQFGFGKPSATIIQKFRLWEPGKYSGEMDRVYLDEGTEGLVLDFKTLFAKQKPANQSWQMRVYAVLVAKHYNRNRVIIGIISPWIAGQFSISEYDAEALEESRIEIEAVVAEALKPNAPRTPGEHCKHCRAKTRCPEARSLLTGVVVASHKRSVETMTPQERGELLSWLDWGQDQIDAKKSELRAMIEADPLAVTGWGLKPGKKRRAISNVGAAKEALAPHLTSQEVEALCTLTPAALEDYLYKTWKDENCGQTRKEAKEAIADALGELVEETQDRESLVKL